MTVRQRLLRPSVLITLLLLAVAVAGMNERRHHLRALQGEAHAAAVMPVIVLTPQTMTQTRHLDLPGSAVGWHDADVDARISGYVRTWTHDIGDHVRAGELLATLRVPELDTQVQQAEADLQTAMTRAQLAQLTLERWRQLYHTHTVSLQDLEDKESAWATSLSLTESSREHLHTLLAQQSYERIVAPFDGEISARLIDVGDLAVADTLHPLFHLTQTSALRVFSAVPQAWSDLIHVGDTVTLSCPQSPGQTLPAQVIQVAAGLDAQQRTRQVELRVDHPGEHLRPGDYVQVRFSSQQGQGLQIPITALIFRGRDLQVASVDAQQRVHLLRLSAGRDFGKSIEILHGLDAHTTVIDNPSDAISEGEAVHIVGHRQDDKTGETP